MGDWNRRWTPRKKSKNDDQFQAHFRANQEKCVPSWEIAFCRAAGVPWRKVVSAKRYMYCYDNVVKWDDSAGEEAFNDAKRRYWMKISGFPPQNPPPNPDLYIDKVDWDAAIKPELLLDLDREYFNPNEVENSVQSENNLVPGCTLVWENKTADNGENPWESGNVRGSKTADNGGNPWESGNVQGSKNADNGENPWESGNVQGSKTADNGGNPWESGNVQGSKTVDNGENPWESGNVQGSKTADNGENPWESCNVQGSKPGNNGENPWESGSFEDTKQTWNEWDKLNVKDDNPWERSSPKTQDILKDTAWGGCGNESWGWNTGMNYENGYAFVDNSFSNLWHQSGDGVSGAKGNEWIDNRVGSWGQTYWNTRGYEQRNADYGSRWNRNLSRGGGTTSKDRRWGESEVTSWNWQRQPRQSNERNVDFGRPSRGDNTFYTGSRKREGSSQHVSRYESSRFQSDEQRTANNWRGGKTQNRVTFSLYD